MPVKKPIIHCDALVVHCMDYRLQKFLQPWITVRFGYDNFDIIALAGPAASATHRLADVARNSLLLRRTIRIASLANSHLGAACGAHAVNRTASASKIGNIFFNIF